MNIEETSYRQILENLNDGLYIVDRNRVIKYWNKAAERITGFNASEVLGKSCADNILTHIDDKGRCLCKGLCPLASTMSDSRYRETEVYLHKKDGLRLQVQVRVNPIIDDKGKITGGVELFTDISGRTTEQLRMKELEKLALIDGLTGLANRNYLETEIEKHMKEYERLEIPFGILFMDIDHFKIFNDTYGHDTGDEVLKAVAGSLSADARPFDLYGRWGGEEFVGVIPNVSPENLKSIGERVRILVENSYLIKDKKRLEVTISIGGTVFRKNDNRESVLKRADTLMYKSKKAGRNRITVG